MRHTRFMSLLFLVLSLAFFGVREFRWAVFMPVRPPELPQVVGPSYVPGRISLAQLNGLARRAEQLGDARSLAYVALHLPHDRKSEIRKFAEQAVARDSGLTWTYHHLAYRLGAPFTAENYRPEVTEEALAWAARVAAWDPENAAPAILRAELIRQRRGASWPSWRPAKPEYLNSLKKETEWGTAMETAFTKPHYDSYSVRRFELERSVLRQQGWDHPTTMVISLINWPLPLFSNIIDYVELIENKLGAEAKTAGRINEAQAQYWKLARFGERLGLSSSSLFEQIVGHNVRVRAYKRLIPILRKAGRSDEAGALEFSVARSQRDVDALHGKMPLARSANYFWSVLVVNLFAAMVWVFLALTVVSVIYVNIKRYYRVEKRGRLWQGMTQAENYLPLLLFLACLGLYITYYPYAQNFNYYMTAQGPIDNLEPLVVNTLPTLWLLQLAAAETALEMRSPFGNYLPWALGGIVFSVVIAFGLQSWQDRAEARRGAAKQTAGV